MTYALNDSSGKQNSIFSEKDVKTWLQNQDKSTYKQRKLYKVMRKDNNYILVV